MPLAQFIDRLVLEHTTNYKVRPTYSAWTRSLSSTRPQPKQDARGPILRSDLTTRTSNTTATKPPHRAMRRRQLVLHYELGCQLLQWLAVTERSVKPLKDFSNFKRTLIYCLYLLTPLPGWPFFPPAPEMILHVVFVANAEP